MSPVFTGRHHRSRLARLLSLAGVTALITVSRPQAGPLRPRPPLVRGTVNPVNDVADITSIRGTYEIRFVIEKGDLAFSVEHPYDGLPPLDVLVKLKEEALRYFAALYPDADEPDEVCTYLTFFSSGRGPLPVDMAHV